MLDEFVPPLHNARLVAPHPAGLNLAVFIFETVVQEVPFPYSVVAPAAPVALPANTNTSEFEEPVA